LDQEATDAKSLGVTGDTLPIAEGVPHQPGSTNA